jgi:hypothetical protein
MKRALMKNIFRRWLGVESSLPIEEEFQSLENSTQRLVDWSVQRTMQESRRAWRENPIARRIVSITSQYVIGKGFRIQCEDEQVQEMLMQFWNHPYNQMELRVKEWCEELCRSGNLFILFSTDLSGMSYVRAIPAESVSEINARENDSEQLVNFRIRRNGFSNGTSAGFPSEETIPAASFDLPNPEPAMLHFSVNRPIGYQWGEPDLAPLLKWISRYSNWLEDRARLNRYRNSFLFVVKSRMIGEAQRVQRQRQLNAIPPEPGSILVTNENENWEVLSPRLESNDANQDGLALKKMIAAGAGIPLHFLAEPESENKASAESSGESTYRHFEQRQQFMIQLIQRVLRQVLLRAAATRPALNAEARIQVFGDDISVSDNLNNARATFYMAQSLEKLSAAGILPLEQCHRIAANLFGDEGRD